MSESERRRPEGSHIHRTIFAGRKTQYERIRHAGPYGSPGGAPVAAAKDAVAKRRQRRACLSPPRSALACSLQTDRMVREPSRPRIQAFVRAEVAALTGGASARAIPTLPVNTPMEIMCVRLRIIAFLSSLTNSVCQPCPWECPDPWVNACRTLPVSAEQAGAHNPDLIEHHHGDCHQQHGKQGRIGSDDGGHNQGTTTRHVSGIGRTPGL